MRQAEGLNGGSKMDMETLRALARAYTAAWNSKDPAAVAAFFAEDGGIVINKGTPWQGRSAVAEMAAGFHRDVPDLALTCDDIRCSDRHAVYVWTFTGHDAQSGRPLRISGWEEWDLTPDGQVAASRGWFDAEDYARQAAGG